MKLSNPTVHLPNYFVYPVRNNRVGNRIDCKEGDFDLIIDLPISSLQNLKVSTFHTITKKNYKITKKISN